jgi:hypothetical protein
MDAHMTKKLKNFPLEENRSLTRNSSLRNSIAFLLISAKQFLSQSGPPLSTLLS